MALFVQDPRENVALPVQGDDPVTCCGSLHVVLVPVVCASELLAWLPGPEAAALVCDYGLVIAGADPAGFHAFWQVDGFGAGCAVVQIQGLSVSVQQEQTLVKSCSLDDAHALVLHDG